MNFKLWISEIFILRHLPKIKCILYIQFQTSVRLGSISYSRSYWFNVIISSILEPLKVKVLVDGFVQRYRDFHSNQGVRLDCIQYKFNWALNASIGNQLQTKYEAVLGVWLDKRFFTYYFIKWISEKTVLKKKLRFLSQKWFLFVTG